MDSTIHSNSSTNVGPIEFSLPALPELLSIPRMTGAAVAAHVGFDVEEVEDIRLAIEELCLCVFEGQDVGRLKVWLAVAQGTLEVRCSFEAEGHSNTMLASHGLASQLTKQLLDALTDEHASNLEATSEIWFRKSHHERTNE